ncbi:9560_t:CDS:2 [Gigaspora rosea]|nr:9560_t:CDS:2 [Gigaspora rosea]
MLISGENSFLNIEESSNFLFEDSSQASCSFIFIEESNQEDYLPIKDLNSPCYNFL